MYTSNDREPTEGLLTLTLTKSQRGWIARKSVSASKWITFYHRRPKPSPFLGLFKHGVGQGDILNANGFLLTCSAPHKLITNSCMRWTQMILDPEIRYLKTAQLWRETSLDMLSYYVSIYWWIPTYLYAFSEVAYLQFNEGLILNLLITTCGRYEIWSESKQCVYCGFRIQAVDPSCPHLIIMHRLASPGIVSSDLMSHNYIAVFEYEIKHNFCLNLNIFRYHFSIYLTETKNSLLNSVL